MTRDDHPNVSDQLYANYAIGQDADFFFRCLDTSLLVVAEMT